MKESQDCWSIPDLAKQSGSKKGNEKACYFLKKLGFLCERGTQKISMANNLASSDLVN
jgi:hypothetical protein